jgi:hypothetical protein
VPRSEKSMIDQPVSPPTFFGRSRLLIVFTVLALFAGGLALRLTNLTAPPLDVLAWRQLRSASIARGLFYDQNPSFDPAHRSQAHYLDVVYGPLEPPILENLVARTYAVFGNDNLWVARLYSIIFWLAASFALFFLAWKTTNIDGAVIAFAYALFLPFGVSYSRAFMPEPLYILWMWLGIYVFYRWADKQKWLLAVLAGAVMGIAILIKVFAAFMLIPAIAFFLLAKFGFKRIVRNLQFYLMVTLSGIIPAVYYVFVVPGTSGNYLDSWSLPFLHLLLDPAFYVRWFHFLSGPFNPALLILAAGSIVLFKKPERWLVVGLWVGYMIFGMTLPALIASHDYYSLPLAPIVGLSLAGLGAFLLPKIVQSGRLGQILFLGLAVVAIGDAAIMARKEIRGADYVAQAAYWQTLSDKLPDGKYVGLVADYGASLNYYGWRFINEYPYSYDIDLARLGGRSFDFSTQAWQFFRSHTDGYDYFLITELKELDAQPYLHDILFGYFPIVKQDKDFIVFDLRHPIKAPPG